MLKTIWVMLLLFVILILGYGIAYWFSMRDVKMPAYKVIKRQGRIEVREYAPLLVAQVIVSGSREQAINDGFRLLAAYIFGDNHTDNNTSSKIAMTAPVMQGPSQKIAMTSPVQQSPTLNGWKVEFVMPSQYTLKTIPKPNNVAVKLIEVAESTQVAIRFSGSINNDRLEYFKNKLIDYVHNNDYIMVSQPQFAFYNPPWTLPWVRRNEVMVQVDTN